MADEKKEKDQEFKVKDKRAFRMKDDGGVEKVAPDAAEEAKSGPDAPAGGVSGEAEKGAGDKDRRDFPPMDFNTFILSLSTSALLNLGIVANPATGKTEKSLPHAKQIIDLMDMLKEKTKGNLKPEESKLIEKILFDLRMAYVEVSKL